MIHVLVDGLGRPKGPGVPPHGSVVFVETYTGKLLRYAAETGLSEFYVSGGGPNAYLRRSYDRVYITQSVGRWNANDDVPQYLQVSEADSSGVGLVDTGRPDPMGIVVDGDGLVPGGRSIRARCAALGPITQSARSVSFPRVARQTASRSTARAMSGSPSRRRTDWIRLRGTAAT